MINQIAITQKISDRLNNKLNDQLYFCPGVDRQTGFSEITAVTNDKPLIESRLFIKFDNSGIEYVWQKTASELKYPELAKTIRNSIKKALHE